MRNRHGRSASLLREAQIEAEGPQLLLQNEHLPSWLVVRMTKKSVSQLEWHLRLQSLLDGWRNGQITLSKELTERKIWDELPAYNPPRDCIQPPKDAYVQCAVWPWHSFSVLAWPQIPSAALLKRPSFFFFSKQTVKADF